MPRFYVVPVATLRAQGSPKAISMGLLNRLGLPAIGFSELADAIKAASHVEVNNENLDASQRQAGER